MTETLSKKYAYPHIEIYAREHGEIFLGHTAKAEDGYVFYEKDAETQEFDAETGEFFPAVHYFKIRLFPPNYNMENFNLVAVKEDEVDSKYIF